MTNSIDTGGLPNDRYTMRVMLVVFESHDETVTALDMLDWQDDGLSVEDIIHQLVRRANSIGGKLQDSINAHARWYWKQKFQG